MSEKRKPDDRLEKSKAEEEQKIRALVRKWAEIANKGDVSGVVDLYAADATLVWAGYPPRKRTAAIHAEVKAMLEMPGMKLGFEPETITVADGLDMASEFGKFTFEYDEISQSPQKSQTQTKRIVTTYKYVVVWRKVFGTWKVLYDCYNANEHGY